MSTQDNIVLHTVLSTTQSFKTSVTENYCCILFLFFIISVLLRLFISC